MYIRLVSILFTLLFYYFSTLTIYYIILQYECRKVNETTANFKSDEYIRGHNQYNLFGLINQHQLISASIANLNPTKY